MTKQAQTSEKKKTNPNFSRTEKCTSLSETKKQALGKVPTQIIEEFNVEDFTENLSYERDVVEEEQESPYPIPYVLQTTTNIQKETDEETKE